MSQLKQLNKRFHLFGEMDLNLSMSRKQIQKEASRIAEACGYFGGTEGDIMTICSNDYDVVKIKFDSNDKVIEVKRSIDDGKTFETLNFEDGIFNVTPEVLKKYNEEINYQKVSDSLKLPMSQGLLIKALIDEYKLYAEAVGYHFDHIGIETKVQFLLWRDTGVGAEFLGGINKDGSDFK